MPWHLSGGLWDHAQPSSARGRLLAWWLCKHKPGVVSFSLAVSHLWAYAARDSGTGGKYVSLLASGSRWVEADVFLWLSNESPGLCCEQRVAECRVCSQRSGALSHGVLVIGPSGERCKVAAALQRSQMKSRCAEENPPSLLPPAVASTAKLLLKGNRAFLLTAGQ